MASPIVALKGPLMNKRDYSLSFALKHALKDMRFALNLGVKVRYRSEGVRDTGRALPFYRTCYEAAPENRGAEQEEVLYFSHRQLPQLVTVYAVHVSLDNHDSRSSSTGSTME